METGKIESYAFSVKRGLDNDFVGDITLYIKTSKGSEYNIGFSDYDTVFMEKAVELFDIFDREDNSFIGEEILIEEIGGSLFITSIKTKKTFKVG